ncbi:hypothetical protein OHA61_38855 [Streptomyces sp. NBC_00885]|uniref:hypothetical protein n=1 Tax=Streptomyces sp. NBC_00885 TaxID=2975857 RepID=UPI003868422E|nr:hypothetical protein OHA61_38855 [Streptomyces sp. NBC_00885]
MSKRTVYDYFGERRRPFLAILSAASDSMLATSRRALDEHLPTDAQITRVPQLEQALTAFAIDLGTSIVGSAAFALVAQQRLQTPTTTDNLATDGASQDLADRIAHFAGAGLLDTDNPRLAADHFSALTVLPAYERQPIPATGERA